MKFSVLLPTRNGGPYLENCIRSILEQDFEDFELIVSDNANTDETLEVLRRFSSDLRLKAVRLDSPVPVTDNWNNALKHSSGDYFLMMGDDDYLLPNYLREMETLLRRHGDPDCVVYNGFSYICPGAINDNRQSYFGAEHFRYGPDLTAEHRLSETERLGIVRDMYRFKVRIPLNMQTILVARRAFGKINGGVFRAPFPDHYALSALLLNADNWVFTPARLVIVGVSPKSFGHYVYSHRLDQGLSYLGIDTDFPGRLPGNELLNGMHAWLNLLKAHYPEPLRGTEVDRGGYVRRQIYAWYLQRKLGALSAGELLRRLRLLSLRDWLGLLASLVDAASWQRLLRIVRTPRGSDIQVQWHGLEPLDNIADIRQFSRWLTAHGLVNE